VRVLFASRHVAKRWLSLPVRTPQKIRRSSTLYLSSLLTIPTMPEKRRFKRGDIWTVSGGKDYAGKPRPAVLVQDNSFDGIDSVTICAFTTGETEAPLFRLPVEPSPSNGLRAECRMMVDKITTVPIAKLGSRIGRLDDTDILRLNRAMLVFLGLAVSPAPRSAK